MLDTRINTFLVLCETMNYTRAAERLCLTQPAVTHHIHYLEEHYGCRLFSYQGKTLSLTPEGQRLLGLARSLAYNSQKAEEAMRAPAALSLRVGATKTIGEFVIAPRVKRLIREFPELSFSIIVDNTRHLLQALDSLQLDLALIEGYYDRERYELLSSRREAFFGVCASCHPFAGKRVTVEQLLEQRIIIREPGSGTRDIFQQMLRRQGYGLDSFSQQMTVSDFSIIKTLVSDSLGVSFLYAPVVEKELEQGSLSRFELEGETMSGAFSLVCLKSNLFARSWADRLLPEERTENKIQ